MYVKFVDNFCGDVKRTFGKINENSSNFSLKFIDVNGIHSTVTFIEL